MESWEYRREKEGAAGGLRAEKRRRPSAFATRASASSRAGPDQTRRGGLGSDGPRRLMTRAVRAAGIAAAAGGAGEASRAGAAAVAGLTFVARASPG